VVLEPGSHVVDVSAPDDKPAHANVTIARGARLQLTVDLVRDEPPPPLARRLPPSHLRRNLGVVSIAAGAAFGIGAVVVLFVRNDLIDSIHTICPNDVCPRSAHDDVESKRAMASALEAPAAVLGGLALAAVAAGVVLVALGPHRRATAAIVPSERGAAFFVRGVF